MIPTVKTDKYELYLGDCLDVMEGMEAESIDIAITSPPYNVGLKYAGYDDNLPDEDFYNFNVKWINSLSRIMAEGARAYIIVSDKMLFDIKPIAENSGLQFAQLLVWCKPNLSGGGGKITGDWNFLTENIMLFRKGKRTQMLNGESNTHNFFVIPTPQSNFKESVDHPAQFPIRLITKILSRTPGKVVFDPFMGSCTVGVVCMKYGLIFCGIEISPQYFDLATKRIEQAARQDPLFTL